MFIFFACLYVPEGIYACQDAKKANQKKGHPKFILQRRTCPAIGGIPAVYTLEGYSLKLAAVSAVLGRVLMGGELENRNY